MAASKSTSNVRVRRKRERDRLSKQTVDDLRYTAEQMGLSGYKSKKKADLVKAIAEAKVPSKAKKAKKGGGGVRHGKGAYVVILAKNNAEYGRLGAYATARAAQSDAKEMLRRMVGDKYALSEAEGQTMVGSAYKSGTVVNAYVALAKEAGAPDLNAAALVIKYARKSKAAYGTPDEVPAKIRNNTRRRSRRNTLPSWRGASAAYSKAYKILEVWNRKEAAAQKRAHTKRGRAASTFRYRPTDEINAFIDALGKGDEEKIKAFNLLYGHMLTKKRNPSKRRNAYMAGWFGPARYQGRVSGKSVALFDGHRFILDPEEVRALGLRKGDTVWVKPAPAGGPGQFDLVKRNPSKRRNAAGDVKIIETATFENASGTPFVYHRVSRKGERGWVSDMDLRDVGEYTASGTPFVFLIKNAKSLGRRVGTKRNPSKRRKNPRVSFQTKSGPVSFMAKKKRNAGADPTVKSGYRSTFHRDGTVSYWNVHARQWERRPAASISDRVLASMDSVERDRVLRAARR
jgi:hypothetical protein